MTTFSSLAAMSSELLSVMGAGAPTAIDREYAHCILLMSMSMFEKELSHHGSTIKWSYLSSRAAGLSSAAPD